MSKDTGAPAAVKWRRKNPYMATVLTNRLLSGEGSVKEIRHFEFDLGDSGITYRPGDGFGVIPLNDPALVSDILKRLNLSAETPVPGKDTDLATYLTTTMEICKPSSAFLKAVAEKGNNEEINRLLENRDREAIEAYLWSKDCLDLLNMHPEISFSAEEFVKLLRPLMHRTYSISSSPSRTPDQIHTTIACVRYHSHNRDHGGVSSTFLSDRVNPGDKVGVFMVPNRNFQLPEGDSDVTGGDYKSLIMIGPGTGIAPFLSFLHERQITGNKGKNWLFFGDQHRKTDYIYQSEIEQFQNSGILTKLDLAFSRDQSEKLYVQHKMAENGAELYHWIQDGAYIYICGDASRMAPDVHEALTEILITHGNKTKDEAIDYLEKMQLEKRYLRDVY